MTIRAYLRSSAFICGLLLCGCDVVIDDPGSGPATTEEKCPDGRCPRPVNPSPVPHQAELPAMDLPQALRIHNYGGGSCVHASTAMCLGWQHQHEWAAFWRSHYSGGESLGGLVSKFENNGLRYAYTDSGDVAFLEAATATRRGAVIFYFPSHSICFCGHHATPQGEFAWLLDNNREDHYLQVPWNEFVREWRGFGGVALTPVYLPPPPNGFAALPVVSCPLSVRKAEVWPPLACLDN